MLKDKDYLLAKSDGVRDCELWLEKKIKEERGKGFPVGQMVETKIGLSKYKKKLRYQANEAEWNAPTASAGHARPADEPLEQYKLSVNRLAEMIDLLDEGKPGDVKGLLEDILSEAGYTDHRVIER